MKKSNVRFFHGEPVFSARSPHAYSERTKKHKIFISCFSTIHLPHSSFPGATGATTFSHTHARVGGICQFTNQKIFGFPSEVSEKNINFATDKVKHQLSERIPSVLVNYYRLNT
jgi:hypothetical protein